jgi:hypothetical protein
MSKIEKTPAFPMYGKDAYTDEAFSNLSFGAQGLFWFLAFWQWSEGSVPVEFAFILKRIPQSKTRETRRVWSEVEPFFPVMESNPSRRANPKVELTRARVCGDRDRKRIGAELTNSKRWGTPVSGSLSESLGSDSHRAASAIDSKETPEKKESETTTHAKPPSVPDFAAAERLRFKIDHAGFRYPPSDQIVVAWLAEFGEELITETLIDTGPEYRGKGYQYFERILISRRDNPNARPNNRRKGNGADKHHGRTAASQVQGSESGTVRPTAASLGMRTAADVLGGKHHGKPKL